DLRSCNKNSTLSPPHWIKSPRCSKSTDSADTPTSSSTSSPPTPTTSTASPAKSWPSPESNAPTPHSSCANSSATASHPYYTASRSPHPRLSEGLSPQRCFRCWLDRTSVV